METGFEKVNVDLFLTSYVIFHVLGLIILLLAQTEIAAEKFNMYELA